MELVLNTFGTSLSRDNEGFVITHKDGDKDYLLLELKVFKSVVVHKSQVML